MCYLPTFFSWEFWVFSSFCTPHSCSLRTTTSGVPGNQSCIKKCYKSMFRKAYVSPPAEHALVATLWNMKAILWTYETSCLPSDLFLSWKVDYSLPSYEGGALHFSLPASMHEWILDRGTQGLHQETDLGSPSLWLEAGSGPKCAASAEAARPGGHRLRSGCDAGCTVWAFPGCFARLSMHWPV